MGKKSSKGDQAQRTKYVTEKHRDKNKIRRLAKHLIRYPHDAIAEQALEDAKKRVG